MSAARTPAGKRYVKTLAFGSRRFDEACEGLFGPRDFAGDLSFVLLDQLAESRTLVRRDAADHFLAGSERALLPEMPGPYISEQSPLRLRLA